MENAFLYYCNTYNSTSTLYAYSYGDLVLGNYSDDGIVQYEESTNTITVIDEMEMKDEEGNERRIRKLKTKREIKGGNGNKG